MSAKRYGPVCGSLRPARRAALFPPEVVSGLSAPSPSAPAACCAEPLAGVVQQYAQLLQLSLGRVSQNRFDLAGLQLAADLQAFFASLQSGSATPQSPQSQEA